MKLIYFNGRGRAELARLVFAAAGEKYEDFRIESADWPTKKASLKLPFGQIPVLEVDGVTLCQSIPIARFVARKFNLAGKTELEQARADMIIACFEDILEAMVDFHFHEPDAARQAEKKKKFLEERLPKFLGYLEDILKENKGGDGFFVGDSLTWADLQLVNIVSWLALAGAESQAASHPKLKALHDKVNKTPNVAAWLEKRPQTPW